MTDICHGPYTEYNKNGKVVKTFYAYNKDLSGILAKIKKDGHTIQRRSGNSSKNPLTGK